MKLFISVLSLMLLFSLNLFAQDSYFSTPDPGLYKGNNTGNYNDVSGLPQVKAKSPEQIELEQQIRYLKNADDPQNRSTLEMLNNRLANLRGDVVKTVEYYGGGITAAQNNPPVNDNIGNKRIYTSTNSIKGIATAVEQRGTHAGRIWIVYAFSANTTSPDSLRVIYSDDGGVTYSGYANVALGNTDKVNYDGLDIEIVESTTGDKYLWCVYSLRSTGGSGNWFVGGFNLDITTFGGTLWALSWPGNNTSYRYYDIHLTSDNGFYTSNSYIYLVCSFDSTDASSNHVNTQKFARCTNPYISTAPTFTYLPTRFWWYLTQGNYVRTLYSDIAYIRNPGGDSVVVSFSGVPDSIRVFFAKCDLGGNAPVAGQYQYGTQTTDYKLNARIASNGYDNGSVICVFNQYTSGVRNVKYFRTTNYGNFWSVNESVLWGSTVSTNFQPDIIGRRDVNTYYISFTTVGSTDSVHYLNIRSDGTWSHINQMNSVALTSGTQGPKAGFRYVNGDSCFVLYSENGPVNIWSAAGCTGTPVGIGNQGQIPADYSLKQNYPNPFNPITKIEYSIAKSGLVKLTVFDLLGREVSTLVNEVKTPGNYTVDFDGTLLSSGIYFYKITSGDFSSIRKMLLIK